MIYTLKGYDDVYPEVLIPLKPMGATTNYSFGLIPQAVWNGSKYLSPTHTLNYHNVIGSFINYFPDSSHTTLDGLPSWVEHETDETPSPCFVELTYNRFIRDYSVIDHSPWIQRHQNARSRLYCRTYLNSSAYSFSVTNMNRVRYEDSNYQPDSIDNNGNYLDFYSHQYHNCYWLTTPINTLTRVDAICAYAIVLFKTSVVPIGSTQDNVFPNFGFNFLMSSTNSNQSEGIVSVLDPCSVGTAPIEMGANRVHHGFGAKFKVLRVVNLSGTSYSYVKLWTYVTKEKTNMYNTNDIYCTLISQPYLNSSLLYPDIYKVICLGAEYFGQTNIH